MKKKGKSLGALQWEHDVYRLSFEAAVTKGSDFFDTLLADKDHRPANEVWLERFHFWRACVLKDKVHVAGYFDKEQLALDALDLLANILRKGEPDAEVFAMLGDFARDYPEKESLPFHLHGTPDRKTLGTIAKYVQGIADQSGNSKNAWEQSIKLAYRILGRSIDRGRGSNESARAAAIDAWYVLAIAEKQGEREALAAAYDAYYAALGRPNRYATDSIPAKASAESKADRFIRTQMKRWLVDGGILQQEKRGPKSA